MNQCINDIQKVKVHTKEVAPSVRIPLEYKELLLIMEEFKMEDASVLEVNKVVWMNDLLSIQWHTVDVVDDIP